MSCIETYVTLRIFSEFMQPEEIGAILGIKATRALARDLESRYRPRRECNFWAWSTQEKDVSLDSVAHINVIVTLLKDKRECLNTLRARGCKIDLMSYWVSNGQGGPSLDIQTMKSLCDLGLEIWWDIYFHNEIPPARQT
jgi:hypothetical protein